MASQSSTQKELDDMTECSICTEVFTDPRVLPCMHTFCLKCLLNYGKDRQLGHRMPCPLCSEKFTIPDDDLSGTPNNVFVEKLLHVRKLSAGKVMCNCSGQQQSEEIKVFCQECKVAVCITCFAESDKTHDCSHIEEVSDNLRTLVVTDKEKVTDSREKTGELLPCLAKEKNDVIKHLAGTDDEVIGGQLKQIHHLSEV